MDTLKNKQYLNYSYLSRMTSTPVYFDILTSKYTNGISVDLNKNTPSVTHKLKRGDTLDSLALKYYNNPTYWWIIAMFNNIQDAFIDITARYTVLQIPNLGALIFEKEKR